MWQVKLPTCHCNDLYCMVGLLFPVLLCTYGLVYDLILYDMSVFLVKFSFFVVAFLLLLFAIYLDWARVTKFSMGKCLGETFLTATHSNTRGWAQSSPIFGFPVFIPTLRNLFPYWGNWWHRSCWPPDRVIGCCSLPSLGRDNRADEFYKVKSQELVTHPASWSRSKSTKNKRTQSQKSGERRR